jgi:hypothetical protein
MGTGPGKKEPLPSSSPGEDVAHRRSEGERRQLRGSPGYNDDDDDGTLGGKQEPHGRLGAGNYLGSSVSVSVPRNPELDKGGRGSRRVRRECSHVLTEPILPNPLCTTTIYEPSVLFLCSSLYNYYYMVASCLTARNRTGITNAWIWISY